MSQNTTARERGLSEERFDELLQSSTIPPECAHYLYDSLLIPDATPEEGIGEYASSIVICIHISPDASDIIDYIERNRSLIDFDALNLPDDVDFSTLDGETLMFAFDSILERLDYTEIDSYGDESDCGDYILIFSPLGGTPKR